MKGIKLRQALELIEKYTLAVNRGSIFDVCKIQTELICFLRENLVEDNPSTD